MTQNNFRNQQAKGLLLVNFQGDDYTIYAEPVRFTDYVNHDVECPSCKDAYPTYEAAARALKLRDEKNQREKRIYKCEFCGHYHFTTNDGHGLSRTHGYERSESKRQLDRTKELLALNVIQMPKLEKTNKTIRVACHTLSGFTQA